MPYCVKCGTPFTTGEHAFCGSCGDPIKAQAAAAAAGSRTVATPTMSAKKAPLAGGVTESKKEKARKWVNGYSLTGGGVAAVAIIPGSTSVALFTLETTMVLHIGRIYRGQQFSKEDALAVVGAASFMGTVGVGAKVAMEGLNFFPVIGWAIKGGIAGSVIKTLGELIIKYFESIEHAA